MLEAPVGYNGYTINDRITAQSQQAAGTFRRWTYLTSVDGLWGDEIRFESHPLPCDDGEISGTAFRSGKQLVLTGGILAVGLEPLRDAQWELAHMFWDLAAHKLYWTPWSLKGTDSLYFTCKVNQPLAMAEETTSLGLFKRTWTIGLRADDPRSYLTSNDTAYPSFQT